MKAKQLSAAFSPVAIELTFETQAELDAFASVFNTALVTNAISAVFGLSFDLYSFHLSEVATEAGGDDGKSSQLATAIRLTK